VKLKLRGEISFPSRLIMGTACLALILLVWFLLTVGEPEARVMSPSVMPSPGEALESFGTLWYDSALTRNLLASIWRVVQGFGLAALVGVPVGILAGTWPRFAAFIAPVSIFGRNVPISALVPITMVWFGIDEMQKVMFIFVACVMFVVFDAARAVANVHERYLQTAFTLGASPRQVLTKVLVPLAAPEIFVSLRLLFGLAFGYIIVAEMVNAEYGLGHLILMAQRRGPLAHVYLVLVVITAVAYGIDRVLLAIQRFLFPYQTA
jgi:NitT/TauT family transport system permease protein